MPTIIKKERIIFISVLIVTLALLLAERLTSMEINSNFLLFFLVFTVIGNLSLIISQYPFDELTREYIVYLLLIVFSVCFGTAVLTWADNWKTQAIFYRNAKHPRQTSEYRMLTKYGYDFEKQIILLGQFDETRIVKAREILKTRIFKKPVATELHFLNENEDMLADEHSGIIHLDL